jgi:TrpR-related protein YerC/YecD
MDWKSKENKKLVKALLSLENEVEARLFLRDLMTEGEIEEFGRRLQAASMLLEKVPYSTIEKETGFSSTTVARVSRWLNRGEGGYKLILNKLHHHDETLQLRRGLS